MLQRVFVAVCIVAMAVAGASADDGEINNKSMSHTIQLPTYPQLVSSHHVPEAEHAFTDMMGFYVPAQAASGAPAGDGTGLITYNDIDGNPVEELAVARPLVNVFIYGPAVGVDGTAFAHRWFDTFAAVSLDDGETWKQTNLSESADLSSFNIDTDHVPSGQDPRPADHHILLGSKNNGAFHADGYDKPFTYHCTECHGPALTGTAQAPSCYTCHGSRWKEEPFEGVGPLIYEAIYKNGKLQGSGENADPHPEVTIIDGTTGDELFVENVTLTGTFSFVWRPNGLPPCTVAAVAGDERGPSLTVTDKDGVPLDDDQCRGLEVDVTDYPGGTYNVFHATAGNKVLVAWPSRFCEQGQPAYQMTAPTDPDLERLQAVTEFIRNGDAGPGVQGLPGFTSPFDGDAVDDLYLVDAFGVAGSQGSIDFADEAYPQAGVVPFGCVWTARGVLLPGDDPRTDELESSHMVWTRAERLTSGRRDPNRIEVKAVKDAGFVISWQEDPEGLRPGQGLGPGEGWSGAVAHKQTDVWYSFINWEYFDLVETVDNTTVPINIMDHDLTLSGRPQVFVPMAVPMRLTNNGKCNPPDTVTSGGGTPALYCDFELASVFGLRDQCADTVTVITGPDNNPDAQTETKLCVADTDGDDFADLPNRANTAATRPRLSLQGYGRRR